MHISAASPCALGRRWSLAASTAHLAGSPAARRRQTAAKAAGGFELTVDSIMRGPKLVGYPPTGLRWSGDSSRLYFEWRRPDDDEASTWVGRRATAATPRKLSDEERRSAPPVNGALGQGAPPRAVRRSRRHRAARLGGRHAAPDHAHDRRRSRTRAGRATNRRSPSRATTTCSSCRSTAARSRSSPTSQPRKRDPRDTDSQKFVKAEEQKLIEHTRVEAEKKKKAEEKEKAHALPKFELADRQSATDLQLSPDGKHVFILVVERTDAAKRPNVPNYVTESSYTEDIPGAHVRRRRAGQAHARGDEPRDRQDAVRPTPASPARDRDRSRTRRQRARSAGACRSCPTTARSPSRTCARPTTRIAGWSPSIRRPARRASLDTLHDDAWVREVGGFGPDDPSFGWLPDQKHLWFLSERDGWMHLYTVDATAAQPAARQLTQGKWEIDSVALSPDKKKFYITSTEVASRRAAHLRDGDRRRRAHEADVDDRRQRRRGRRPTTARSASSTRTAPSRTRCT